MGKPVGPFLFASLFSLAPHWPYVDNRAMPSSSPHRIWPMVVLAFAVASHGVRTQTTPGAIPPERLLLIETSKGRIIVEMRPDVAPNAVERVTRLARMSVYDGLQFHRVVDHFVAQTGNPNNRDGGASDLPNLAPEFMLRLKSGNLSPVATRTIDGWSGFLGSLPVQAEPSRRADGTSRAWGAYCAGTAGMGRQAGVDTANSEIFFMRAPARRLDHDYAVWGQVVQGLAVVRAINVGEPPKDPDRMLRVRVAADLPAAERPRLEIANPRGPMFQARLAQMRARKGASFSVCDVPIEGREAR